MGQAFVRLAAYLLNGAAEFVANTETPWDDLAVEVLGVIIESEAVQNWLADLLDNTPPDVMFAVGDAPEAVKAAFVGKGIPWDKVIEYLPQILALARILFGK